MSEKRCDLTDLIEDQCSHCRGDDEEREYEWGWNEVEPSPQGPAFTAQYPGKCARCGDLFDEGDRICRAQTGYLCAGCIS